ncbi:MAG: alcohol dehydrogenase catalytic domain-containing protein [Nitrospinae bacterium]|nr:alcohol dehydrogenase catalytic domain-containing protein [Nitrospinota bacterium]
MKAFVASAQWAPRKDYQLSPLEKQSSLANVGNRVWRNPSFEMKDMPVPDTGRDELLIKVKRCGVCGSDTHLYETDDEGYIIFSGPTRLPCVIGHEYAGVVENVGEDVVFFKPGDLVAVESVLWCGRCLACRSGAVNQCERVELAGLTADGALAEYAKAKEWHCWSLNSLRQRYSDENAMELGALIEPVGCAYNGLFVAGGGFMPGSVVAVFGLGPIGLAAVALARIAGASQVLGFDVIPERLEVARKLGADKVFNFNDGDPVTQIKSLTGGRGAEVCVEAAGAGQYTVPVMEKALANNGKLIYLGRAARTVSVDLNRMVTSAGSIIGARGHAGYGIFDKIIRLMATGRLDVEGMITSRYPFTSTVEALKASTVRKDGKIMVSF